MAARHFACTACGKCCAGTLPLTVGEALTHARLFPLAVAWMPVRKGAKAYESTLEFGLAVDLPGRIKAAVRVMPAAYLPKNAPCPALTPDGLCSMHQTKPQRCRTMPFLGWRAEADQTELLVPRPGWKCDVSAAAPVLYDRKTIVDRGDYDSERAALADQAPIMRAYAQALLSMAAGLPQALAAAATKGGEIYLGFSGLLKKLQDVDRAAVAALQADVWAAREGSDEYGRHAVAFAQESRRLAAR